MWCAWLAWSRFRVVIPVLDKTLPTIVACLDATLRRLGGVPAYVLTDNEKTITVEHVADVAVRNPEIVQVARHYGMTIRTCVPADPQSKGGAENTVKIAKADLVPTRRTCSSSTASSPSSRRPAATSPSRSTTGSTARPAAARPKPCSRNRPGCTRCPPQPFTVAFGTTRRVNWDCTISVEGVRYSVPHHLVDTRVWARFHGDELIVTAVTDTGPAEVARHQRAQPGRPVDRRRALPAAHPAGRHRRTGAAGPHR